MKQNREESKSRAPVFSGRQAPTHPNEPRSWQTDDQLCSAGQSRTSHSFRLRRRIFRSYAIAWLCSLSPAHCLARRILPHHSDPSKTRPIQISTDTHEPMHQSSQRPTSPRTPPSPPSRGVLGERFVARPVGVIEASVCRGFRAPSRPIMRER